MHFFRIVRPALAAASLLATVITSAADLSGTYENAGILVSSATAQPEGTISFQGLLSLEFDYALARALHAETNRVTIRQTETHFTIECRNLDDQVTWSRRWQKGAGYGVEGDRAELVFRAPQLKDDAYVFSLQRVPQRDLLLVTVERLNATSFGPSAQPVGTFLFGRLAGE